MTGHGGREAWTRATFRAWWPPRGPAGVPAMADMVAAPWQARPQPGAGWPTAPPQQTARSTGCRRFKALPLVLGRQHVVVSRVRWIARTATANCSVSPAAWAAGERVGATLGASAISVTPLRKQRHFGDRLGVECSRSVSVVRLHAACCLATLSEAGQYSLRVASTLATRG